MSNIKNRETEKLFETIGMKYGFVYGEYGSSETIIYNFKNENEGYLSLYYYGFDEMQGYELLLIELCFDDIECISCIIPFIPDKKHIEKIIKLALKKSKRVVKAIEIFERIKKMRMKASSNNTKRKKINYEEQEQIAVVGWCRANNIDIVPSFSGIYIASFTVLRLMKALGLTKGEPDFFIPYMRGGYGALFIEMKRSKKFGSSKVSIEQKARHEQLKERGYKVVVCYGYDEAVDTIKAYMSSSRDSEVLSQSEIDVVLENKAKEYDSTAAYD